MPILTNTTDQPIRATTGHTIPAFDSLTISQAALERVAAEPYIARVMRQGRLVLEPDVAPDEDAPITRETVAKMKRAELLEVLDAHGVTEDQVEGKYVDDLREMAARIMFADL